MVPIIYFGLNAAIFLVDNFCNCLNSSCSSFGKKQKNKINHVVLGLISINSHVGGAEKN